MHSSSALVVSLVDIVSSSCLGNVSFAGDTSSVGKYNSPQSLPNRMQPQTSKLAILMDGKEY